MKRILFSLAVATSLIVPAAALACEGENHQAKSLEPTKATVTEVATWTKEKKATPVDANGKETRTSQGVIPGAVLLTSSSQYAVSELPRGQVVEARLLLRQHQVRRLARGRQARDGERVHQRRRAPRGHRGLEAGRSADRQAEQHLSHGLR